MLFIHISETGENKKRKLRENTKSKGANFNFQPTKMGQIGCMLLIKGQKGNSVTASV